MIELKVLVIVLACGVTALASENDTENDISNYIIGGRTANPGQFPHIVSMRTLQNRHFCGGFILSNRWVATSGRCTSGRYLSNPANILIVTGAHSLTDGKRHRAARIVRHPRFNLARKKFDIAVIQTKETIQFNQRVRAVRLPTGPKLKEGEAVRFAGWGLIRVSNLLSNNSDPHL